MMFRISRMAPLPRLLGRASRVDDLDRAARQCALALERQLGLEAEGRGQAHAVAEQERQDDQLEPVESAQRAIGLDRARPADEMYVAARPGGAEPLEQPPGSAVGEDGVG